MGQNYKFGLFAIFLSLLLSMYSCWQTAPDGREFRIQHTCLYGHYEDRPYHYNIGKCISCGVAYHQVWECDMYRCDTIWRQQGNIGQGIGGGNVGLFDDGK